jgi:hypothetical protein
MRFEELSLPIGKTFTLSLVGLDYKTHQFEAQLLGYQKGKNLLLSIPSKPGQILLQAGTSVSVSTRVAQGSVKFDGAIEHIHQSPFLYLVLDYPVYVDFEQHRKEARFPVDTALEIYGHTGLGMKTSVIHGYMLDVSRNGARIVLEKELTTMITKIDMGVMLGEQDLTRDMTLIGEVRNKAALSKQYPDCSFAYGIEFVEKNDIDTLFLQAYCLQEILSENALIY